MLGSSSLLIEHDIAGMFWRCGSCGSEPWDAYEAAHDGKKVKFLCPVPGYDRHFGITADLGIENIPVAMTDNGPDMDEIERLVAADDSIKGIWCVPKYSNTIEAVKEHMKKHAEFLRPRFEAVERKLTEGLGDTGCATWTHPRGGYFVSFDGPEGSAQKVAALCADLGVKLTPAGATWPYGKDPRDTNIRIAPSYPTVEDLEAALDVLVLAVKLVAAELARAERA